MAAKVAHLVADTGAFIRNVQLWNIAENIYTIAAVIHESCDRATRRRLKVFPVDIKIKEPSNEALSIVTSFAKKTGDYLALSAVDLKVLALVYDLEKQFRGVEHLRKEPVNKTEWTVNSKIGSGVTVTSKQLEEGEILASDKIGEKLETDSDDEEYFDATDSTDFVDENTDDRAEEDLEEKSESDDDDDNDDWITPANIMEVKKLMGVETTETTDNVCVGCLTTDFAMQNVLIQIGLNVLSIDGLVIKKAKSYVLRCFGCMRITKDTSKIFCPHCGNKTLRRLSTTIEQDGSVRYWLAKNYTIRTRGTKFSLPKHQGGKHASNPILFADQPIPDQRPTKKSLQKIDILSADIIADTSPFRMNDVTSRAAQLGIRGHVTPQWSKRNPNENRKKVNKRK